MQSLSRVLPLFPLFSTDSEESVIGTELRALHMTAQLNTTINEPQRVIEVQDTGSLL